MDLDGRTFHVSSTAQDGVVDGSTRLHFIQRGPKVVARYRGGRVERGWLAGRVVGGRLAFRYVQRESAGALHAGRSVCEVLQLADGRVRILEHFEWRTRSGSGINVFDEVRAN